MIEIDKLIRRPEHQVQSRHQRRLLDTQMREIQLNHFLEKFGIVDQDPDNLGLNQRPLIELAHLNGRLLRRGFIPLYEEQWSEFLGQVGKAPRGSQLQLLEANGLLIRQVV